MWLVSQSAAADAIVYRSTDYGVTFTAVATIAGVASSQLAFDPAVSLGADGKLHIIGQVKNGAAIELWRFVFDTSTQTLSAASKLVLDGIIGSDYDVVALSAGKSYVVSCSINATQEKLEGFLLNADGTVAATDIIVSESLYAGGRYGAVSLVSPDGAAVEVYLNSHPKLVTFSDFTITLSLITRSSGGSVSAPSTLTTLAARHVDDRLTVIANGTMRYLSLCYYTQPKLQLIGNILFGTTVSGSWEFASFTGTVTKSLVEPTVLVTSNAVHLGYIERDFTASRSLDMPVRLALVDPTTFTLSTAPDFRFTAAASFLRGTKSILPTAMSWGLLAQRRADGVAVFYSGYVTSPVVVLSPSTLAARRGVTYRFDAGQSYSPHGDDLSFSWHVTDPTGQAVFTVSGSSATLLLPKSVGAAAFNLAVTVTVQGLDVSGSPVGASASQTSTVTYIAVAPPVITVPGTIAAPRNATVSYVPTVTEASGDTLSYLWSQSSGTTLTMLSKSTDSTLVFETNGAPVAGQTITFDLTVDDGMNTPVTQTITFHVAARAASGETQVLNRSIRSGDISTRNTQQNWGAPISLTTVTEFKDAKRSSLTSGEKVSLYIGPKSVLVQRGTYTSPVNYHVYTPDVSELVVDAVHSDYDATLLLTDSGKLYLLPPNNTLTDTDNVTASIVISTYSTKSYSRMVATPSFGGQRVVLLSGSEGAFLFQVDTKTLAVAGYMEISIASGFLYGSDDVQFIRATAVESIHTGELLVGTMSATGATYETVISLANRSIIATFDASALKSSTITTGEIIFITADSYSGQAMAPVVNNPTPLLTGGCSLSWTQTRKDLVAGYAVYVSTDGATFGLYGTVNSGQVTSLAANSLRTGTQYWFRVQALSFDANSPYSNVVTFSA
jgi:hypothetical protein